MPHPLKGLYGVAYSCSSRVNKYCDDWFTKKYQDVYKSYNSRSLKEVRKLGFNHIRTYYLNPDEDHSDFLEACSELNLSIEIGISNDLVERRNTGLINKLVSSTKMHKCVKIYTVGNEYSGPADDVVFCLNYIFSLDSNKHLMHSVIFDDNFQSAKNVFRLLSNTSGIKHKYIVSINMYFYNNSPASHGDVLQNVLNEYYRDDELKNTYLIISEFGNNTTNSEEQWNSLWNFNFGMVECLKKYNKFLGYCLFSFTNESWKGIENGEDNYGILTEDGDKKSGYYSVEQFKNSDAFRQYIRK